jgi:DNA-binding MarR family transcriptional regulator
VGGTRTTPEASPNPGDVFRAIFLANTKMPHFFEKALEEVGLRLTEYRVLQRLSVSGATPMAKLTDETLVTKAAITAIIDQMEKRGMVKRVRDSADRRIVNVQVTPEGRKLFAVARKRHDAILTKFVSLLDAEETRVLLRAYEKLNKFVD